MGSPHRAARLLTSPRARDRGTSAIALGLGALAWELGSRAIASPFFPPLSDVIRTLMTMTRDGEIVGPLAASAASLAIGLSSAIVLGVAIGLAMARSSIVEHLLDVYLDGLMAAPAVIYVPILLALFGVTRATQVVIVFTHAFFVVATTTFAGAHHVDRRLVAMARAFGASDRQIFRRVALPAARPFVLTGLRLGALRAVKGMVIGEMILALGGLGALLKAYGARFAMSNVLAVLLVIVVVSAGATAIVGAIGRAVVGGGGFADIASDAVRD